MSMALNAFINRIQAFSNNLTNYFYLNQKALQKSHCPMPIEEEENYDDDIIHYEEFPKKQQNPSYLSCSDRLKGLSETEDGSDFFEVWKSRYLNKLSKMFKRQKQEQLMELNALKESIIRQFGEVGEQFHWMIKEDQIPNDSLVSCRLAQKKEYFLSNLQRRDNVQFTLIEEDYSRLMPGKDLNDALIDSYLKIMKTFILPEEVNKQSFIFSTYLLHILTSQVELQAQTGQIDIFAQHFGQTARQQVRKKYDKVQKWNRKIDIFDKKILVFPINMHVHWFCVIVLNPGSLIQEENLQQDKCNIIFCDSMFEQRFFVVEAIREYLSLQLQFKRNIKLQVTQQKAPSFQLLLPRQTNKHDCGLYMLAYIQELLSNHKQHFASLHEIDKRNKLRYFPRRYMHSLRQRIMKLFIDLYQKQMSPEKTDKVLQKYIKEKENIYEVADKTQDFDFIHKQEFQRFLAFIKFERNNMEDQVQHYRFLIKFSLSSEVNYIEKDSQQEQTQFATDQDTEYT